MPRPKRSALLREITPPVLVRLLRPAKARLTRRNGAGSQLDVDGGQKDSAYYDDLFHNNEHFLLHYTRSQYYPVWAVIADRIARAGVTSIVDVGCGPGQVAALLRDRGVPHYLGVDFSDARIAQARKVCPEYEFQCVDIFQSDVLKARDYDAVVATEFLEHIDRDLDVLDAIRSGTHLFGAVPSYGAGGHVRHFKTSAEVRERYGSRFRELDVQVQRADATERLFVIFDGIKT